MKKVSNIKSKILSFALQSMSDAVIGSTVDGSIIFWNRGAEKIFGYSENEVIGKNLSILIPPFYPHEMPDILDSIIGGNEVDHYETLRQTKSGKTIKMSITASAIMDSDGEIAGVSIIGRDITSRKKIEKEILNAGNNERERIGSDLHDSLGQQLTGISLKLKAFENSLDIKQDTSKIKEVKEITGLIIEALEQTKSISRGLISSTLQREGLHTALQELALTAEKMYRKRINCVVDESIDIADNIISMQLYYITREAVHNAIKHCKSKNIEIKLVREEDDYCLTVIDDGIGFRNKNRSGLGLKIMNYRANIIDSKLIVYQAENGGTVVKCRVPVQNEKPDNQ